MKTGNIGRLAAALLSSFLYISVPGAAKAAIVAGDLLLIVYDPGDQWTYILDLGATGQTFASYVVSPLYSLGEDFNWLQFTQLSPDGVFEYEIYGGTGTAKTNAVSYVSPFNGSVTNTNNLLAVQRYRSLVIAANSLSPSPFNSVINTAPGSAADFNALGLQSLGFYSSPNQMGTNAVWAQYSYTGSLFEYPILTKYDGDFLLSYNSLQYTPTNLPPPPATDAPIPPWAFFTLGAGLVGLASRRKKPA